MTRQEAEQRVTPEGMLKASLMLNISTDNIITVHPSFFIHVIVAVHYIYINKLEIPLQVIYIYIYHRHRQRERDRRTAAASCCTC